MADGEDNDSTGSMHYSKNKNLKRPRSRPVKVEISDSSSEDNHEEDDPASSNVACSLKSIPQIEPDNMECPVCLQTCMHPARLPCGHIFCFLCLKGIAQQSKRCAMCRQEISPDYLDRPDLLKVPDTNSSTKEMEAEYQWFYEGRNGWWQYDERTSQELEVSYKSGVHTCELLIAGFLYTVDFELMVQMRRTEPHRRRRIKRDVSTILKKGVAGICNVTIDSVIGELNTLSLNENVVDSAANT